MNKMTGEEFLQSKDIWNHPNLTDRNNKESYDVADLLEEYAELKPTKRKPLSDGTLPLTGEELEEFWNIWTGLLQRKYNPQYQIKRFWIDFRGDETVLMIEMSNNGIDIGSSFVRDLEAILYLAERFDLTGEK